MAGICTCGFAARAKAGTQTIDGDEVCNECGRFVDRDETARANAPSPIALVRERAREADRVLVLAFWVGVVAVLLGGLLVSAGWPGEELGVNGVEETGSFAGVVIGAFITFAGQCSILVALVGWGVKLGTRAAQQP